MAILIPNLKLRKILSVYIDLIRTQHNIVVADGRESESWLYRVFYGVEEENFDFYEQAKNIIIDRDDDNHNKLEIRLNFNGDVAPSPTIYINNPSEVQDGVNTINLGDDQGHYYLNTDTDETEQDIYFRTFRGDYELMVTSANQLETELLYRFLFALFIAFADTLNENFDGTFLFSGKALMANPELIPYPMYFKVMSLTVFNRFEVPRFTQETYGVNDLQYTGTPVDEES